MVGVLVEPMQTIDNVILLLPAVKPLNYALIAI